MSPQEKKTLIISCGVIILVCVFMNYMYEHYRCEEEEGSGVGSLCKK